ncbi:MAG: hypothetical protein OEM85_15885 [Gammaproteobacteria bacterium]|nr:hypothetical protein [Gammaproteobacteria bacterium]MDH3374846.1 hypothetical protein [Gammaproteobacteria bacterium]
MIWLQRNTRFRILVVVMLFIAQSGVLASDQDLTADPEIIQELLDTVGRLTRSSWGKCPYVGLRVRPPHVSSADESGYVLVVFDVSTYGRAINVDVIDSNLGEEQQAEALELIKLFRIRPIIVESGASVFENWVERIDFLPEGVEPDPAWPQAESYNSERCR